MGSYTEVKDSGVRQDFTTGSVRDTNEGKGRFDLLSPIFLTRLAQHTQNGSQKYGDRNWELGQPVSRFFDSAMRHLMKYLEGHRDEDHLAAAAWNIQGIIHVEEMIRRGKLPVSLLDWPMYTVEAGQTPDPKAIPHPDLPPPDSGWRYTGERRHPRKGEHFMEYDDSAMGFVVGLADRDFVIDCWILEKVNV